MKNLIFCSLILAAIVGGGVAARAEDDMSHLPAILLCRAATTNEVPTATTSTNDSLICKPLDMKPLMAMKAALQSMPNGEKIWQTYVYNTFAGLNER